MPIWQPQPYAITNGDPRWAGINADMTHRTDSVARQRAHRTHDRASGGGKAHKTYARPALREFAGCAHRQPGTPTSKAVCQPSIYPAGKSADAATVCPYPDQSLYAVSDVPTVAAHQQHAAAQIRYSTWKRSRAVRPVASTTWHLSSRTRAGFAASSMPMADAIDDRGWRGGRTSRISLPLKKCGHMGARYSCRRKDCRNSSRRGSLQMCLECPLCCSPAPTPRPPAW